jgi:phosphatidylinositol-3-phosphatase
MRTGLRVAVLTAAVLASTACGRTAGAPHGTPSGSGTSSTTGALSSTSASASSRPGTASTQSVATGHVVIVVMENHSYSDVIGSSQAPYLNSLARQGRSLTRMYAITHPSEPNYVALFSGTTHGLTDDSCPHRYTGSNLGRELLDAHRTFAGYSEGLPGTGSTACSAGAYARKHAPWVNFADLPTSVNKPLSSMPTDYARLPTVSFVIPDLNHDMHDGSVRQGDTWLKQHLGGYARWAAAHDSLLVVTWDEDDRSESNRIPTVVVGARVTAGRVGTRLTLYSVLRMLEDRYGLHRLGASATAPAIPLN